MSIIQELEKAQVAAILGDRSIPPFAPGDTVKVNVKVTEGTRTRIQAYEGVCIARAGGGLNENFTVRKISYGEGVERVFPVYSPSIDSIEVVRRGKVRRAKLYYLRGRRGKSARIAEKQDHASREAAAWHRKQRPSRHALAAANIMDGRPGAALSATGRAFTTFAGIAEVAGGPAAANAILTIFAVTAGSILWNGGRSGVLSRRTLLKTIGLGALGVVGLTSYAFAIEPRFRLVVTRYRLALPDWPANSKPLSMAVIADIHACDPWMPLSRVSEIVSVANSLAPDVTLLLGDYVAGPPPLPHLGGAADRVGPGAGRPFRSARRLWRHRQSRLVARYRRRAARLRRQQSSADGKRRACAWSRRTGRPSGWSASATSSPIHSGVGVSAVSTICRGRLRRSPRTARRSF